MLTNGHGNQTARHQSVAWEQDINMTQHIDSLAARYGCAIPFTALMVKLTLNLDGCWQQGWFLDHKQRCHFLISEIKYCAIIKTGDTNLYLHVLFLSAFILLTFSPLSPSITIHYTSKLFYLISDKTLLNLIHFL